MVVSQHAGAALSQRTWGVPALATYFHATFGWGIIVVMQALRFERPFVSVLLGPLVALLWDPILRIVRVLVADATDVTLAPAIMGVTLLVALLTAPAIPTHTIPTDWLLFAAPALNQLYFGASGNRRERQAIVGARVTMLQHSDLPRRMRCILPPAHAPHAAYARTCVPVTHALFRGGADVLAPDHKAVIAAISLVSTLAFARAAGILTPWSKPSPVVQAGESAGW